MIKTFKHRGLRRFFLEGLAAGINPQHTSRIRKILARLNAAEKVETMNVAGARLHQHKGDRKGIWSVNVSGNYRIFFRFDNGNTYDVDYGDPH